MSKLEVVLLPFASHESKRKMSKAMKLLSAILFSLVYVATAQSDTLTLRRPDGSTYEMEGDIKGYKDGKFLVALTSGGETTFPTDQVQVISFEATKKAVKQEKVKKVNLDIQSVHIKSLLESLRETFDFNIIYSPDARDSFTSFLHPDLIKDRLTFYQEDASLEDMLKIISAQTDFKCEMVQGPIVRVTLKDSFDVKTLSDREHEHWVFIKVKCECNVKTAQDVGLKIYALLGSGSKKKVASGSIKLAKVERGYQEQTFMIIPSYTESYGTPQKLRVEIWYNDGLAASKTKPDTAEEKWWEGETTNIILLSDDKIEKLIRDYKD